MDLQLDSKLALVTASTGGIGKEIAISLAREGATVIINGRTGDSVAAAAADIRGRVPGAKLKSLVADNGTAEGAAETSRQFPEVDILINNLGIYEAVGFFDETDEAWMRLFEVNILSGVRLARHYLKVMLARKSGRVIFIASEAAISPSPEMAHYSATKTMQLSRVPQPGRADKRHIRHGKYHNARLNQNRGCRQTGPGPLPQRGSRRSRTPIYARKPSHVTHRASYRAERSRTLSLSSAARSLRRSMALRSESTAVSSAACFNRRIPR